MLRSELGVSAGGQVLLHLGLVQGLAICRQQMEVAQPRALSAQLVADVQPVGFPSVEVADAVGEHCLHTVDVGELAAVGG